VRHCEVSGLVDVSVLAIDGTKIRASSSSRRTVSKKKLDTLGTQFQAALAQDAAAEGEGFNDACGDCQDWVPIRFWRAVGSYLCAVRNPFLTALTKPSRKGS
jgi:hypothetical protein